MAERENREGLSNLNDLKDYEVADGEPDPRGWDVFAGDGVKVGRIEDLLVDTGQMRVRAIECRIDEQGLQLPRGDRSLFIPIRSVSLDEGAERAVVPSLRSDQIESMRGRTDFSTFGSTETGREIGRGESRTRETRMREPRTGEPRTGEPGTRETMRAGGGEEFHIPRSEEELDVGKRTVRSGEVDVHKHVETEHVSKPVHVRHEEVDIERHPVSGQSASSANFREKDIRIPISEEEIVVGKRPVVREEIVLRKREIDETRQAEADLRRERVDIEKKGDTRTRNERERGRRR